MSRENFILAVLITFFSVTICSGQPSGLSIDKSSSRIEILGESAILNLVINRAGAESGQVRIVISVVDSGDRLRYSGGGTNTLQPGRNETRFEFAHLNQKEGVSDQAFWRLKYKIEPVGGGFAESGILSFSELNRDFFDLKVTAPQFVHYGEPFEVICFTSRLLGGEPMPGVSIAATLSDDYSDGKLGARRKTYEIKTDADGLATLTMTVPRPEKFSSSEEFELKINATFKGIVQTTFSTLKQPLRKTAYVNTDKSLYQPGQVVHSRLLFLDSARKAVPGFKIKGQLLNEKGEEVCSRELLTSRYGIASFDCKLEADSKVGSYDLKFESSDGDETLHRSMIHVSKYELPGFRVEASTDRPFYLPGQKPTVEVSAQYLFGKPVKSGTGYIRREESREWSAEARKYIELPQRDTTLQFDSNGKASVEIDLAEAQKLLDEKDPQAYRDLHYLASFTDSSSGRTEVRKFDLRLTRNAIHLHIISRKSALPDKYNPVYINAEYADGRPAACEGKLFLKKKGDASGIEIAAFTTNTRGVARLREARALKGFDLKESDEDDYSISLEAEGKDGAKGVLETSLFLPDGALRVETNHALYRPGQAVEVAVYSQQEGEAVRVQLEGKGRSLGVATGRISDGIFRYTFPYDQDFRETISVTAFMRGRDEEGGTTLQRGERRIIFPINGSLKAGISLSRTEWLPGQEASFNLSMAKRGKREMQGAFGVSIVDTALLQREYSESIRSTPLPIAGLTDIGPEWGLGDLEFADLNNLDNSQPYDEALDLAVEALLFRSPESYWTDEDGGKYISSPGHLFRNWMENSLSAARSALSSFSSQAGIFPTNTVEIENVLLAANIDPSQLKDPWGRPYKVEFKLAGVDDLLRFISAGIDGVYGTEDDLVGLEIKSRYFPVLSDLLTRVTAIFEVKKGHSPRNESEVFEAIGMAGISVGQLSDRWGRPYRFTITSSGRNFSLGLLSAGPDGKFESDAGVAGDDVLVGTVRLNPFGTFRRRLWIALEKFYEVFADYPANLRELELALRNAGMDLDAMKDPNGNGFYVSVEDEQKREVRTHLEDIKLEGGKTQTVSVSVPVMVSIRKVMISGLGGDQLRNTEDDYTILTEPITLGESPLAVGIETAVTSPTNIAMGTEEKRTRGQVLPEPFGGSIYGVVLDPVGAVIPGATVSAVLEGKEVEYSGVSNANGVFLLKGLRPGAYTVRISSPGFVVSTFQSLIIKAGVTSRLDVVLRVGVATETVTISAETVSLSTTSASVTSLQLLSLSPGLVSNGKSGRVASDMPLPLAPVSTPRVRKYFPETAYWNPEIETDRNGRATVKFKMPDNITTWRIRVIGSTADGDIAVADENLLAFQPFFAEIDTPKILTQGDEISEPVIVRNYSAKDLSVKVSLHPASFFRASGDLTQTKTVPAGGYSRTDFPLRFTGLVASAALSASAIGEKIADALERELSIHPDGQARYATSFIAFNGKGNLDLQTGADAIADSIDGALIVYPNLGAHILEGVTTILTRPHGCAEQTISSSYPSAIAARLMSSLGAQNEEKRLLETTDLYLELGYKKLQGYRREDGGYTYWGTGDANLPLTAYALEFLMDAREFLEIEPADIPRTQRLLVNAQEKNGAWPVSAYSVPGDSRFGVRSTSTIVRALAADSKATAEVKAASERGLAYLRHWMEISVDAYTLANCVLAAHSLGNEEAERWGVEKLKEVAIVDGNSAHWSVEGATPFYGWGLAGQVETTAQVLRALATVNGPGNKRALQPLIDSGLGWLMRNKDEAGMWRTSQATVAVYRALERLISVTGGREGGKVAVAVNGKLASTLDLPESAKVSSPLRVDLTGKLKPGGNSIEVIKEEGKGYTTAQARVGFYRPWDGVKEGGALDKERFLDLSVKFDKTEARVGEAIRCDIEVARIGRYGWGMMVAEIGLPPGVDIEKADLEAVITKRVVGLDHYEIQPDKVVLYLWPGSREAKFSFTFKPRLVMKAKSAPSLLYDYYNPDAQALAKPVQFTVR